MASANRVITRIQDQDDFSGSLTSGQYLKWNGSAFVVALIASPVSLTPSSTTETPLTINAIASQTAPLQAWKNAGGGTAAQIDPLGFMLGAEYNVFLDVSFLYSSFGFAFAGTSSAFTKAYFDTAHNGSGSGTVASVTDPGGNWSASNGWYVVPKTGAYMIVTKLRLLDGASSGDSYGQGVGTALADGSHFQWFVVAPNRSGSLNIRIAQFNAGDKIFMYYYADSFTPQITSLEMSIILLGAPTV